MSTRTTIKLMKNGEVLASLYRHMDGYPAETGADIIEKAKKYQGNPNGFVCELLSETYEMASCDTEPRHIYRIEPTAGDIEHYYIVEFGYNSDDKPAVIVRHASRPSNYPQLDEWICNQAIYNLSEFAAVVNAERREMNKRHMSMYPETAPEELYQPVEA